MAKKPELFEIEDQPLAIQHPSRIITQSSRADTFVTVRKKDGWGNVLAGLGSTRDKRQYTKYNKTLYVDKYTLADAYLGDGLVTKIINGFPDDMTREWGLYRGPDRKLFQEEEERLQVQATMNQALKWASLFGGSLIFVGAMDGNPPDTPLNLSKIKKIEFLQVYDLGDIDTGACEFEGRPTNPMYGKITKYSVITQVGIQQRHEMLHHTRCIPFYGLRMPNSIRAGISLIELRYWGASRMQPVWDYLRDFSGSMASVGHILYEYIIGKYTFSDLDEILAQGNETKLQTRMNAIDMTKSVIHSVLLGTDEKYERDTASLTGVADVLDRFQMNVSAVTEYPVTKLFGRSSAGLNATGENDRKGYYDTAKARQTTELLPAHNAFLTILAAALNKTKPKFYWKPLETPTEQDRMETKRIKAENYRTTSDADQRYMDSGVVDPEEVRKLRFPKLPKRKIVPQLEMREEPEDLLEEDPKRKETKKV